MINIDKFIGEPIPDAISELDAPCKKVLLEVAKNDGIKWAKEHDVDFHFVNRVIFVAKDYADKNSTEKDPTKKFLIKQADMFGFIAGVIEYINEKED